MRRRRLLRSVLWRLFRFRILPRIPERAGRADVQPDGPKRDGGPRTILPADHRAIYGKKACTWAPPNSIKIAANIKKVATIKRMIEEEDV